MHRGWASTLLGLLCLVLGIVIPLTFNPGPVVLTILWMVVAILLLAIVVLMTPLRKSLARLGDSGVASPNPSVVPAVNINIGDNSARTSPPAVGLEKILLASLVTPNDPVLRYQTIEGKELVGPAMMVIMDDHCELTNITWTTSDVEAVLYERPKKDSYAGVIGVQSCVFRRCVFTNIALMSDEPILQMLRDNFTPPQTGT
jgi:hypothetical protein